tara:strand:- start:7456 stop:7998 length:543 start_codon:yes stop_codon:yes gene_type:complete
MRLEYMPLPPPQNIEAYPVYINNELQRIARFIGGISEVHETGMFLATSGATMALSTTPTTITAYDTVRVDEEGMTASHSAGTITFLSDSKYTLTFSANIKRHGGGSSAAIIGVFLDGTLISGTHHTLDFNGSSYIPISFSSNGAVNAGQVITVKMSLASGTTDVTFDTIDLNVTGKAIDV